MIIARYDSVFDQSERAHRYNHLSNYAKSSYIQNRFSQLSLKLFLQVIIPVIWISTLIINTPFFLTSYFSKEDNFCMEHWPDEWMAKAYSLTWFVLLGALPMLIMMVLYSRVVYSLWIKDEERASGTQQVINRAELILY